MRVLAVIIVVAIVAGWTAMMANGRQGEYLPGVQAVAFVERMPGPNAKMLQPHDDDAVKIETPITSHNLFNCRSGKFDCDDDICVWACELNKGEDDLTYPLDHGQNIPGPEEQGVAPEQMPLPPPDIEPFTEHDSPSKCEPDEDGRFDCPQDL